MIAKLVTHAATRDEAAAKLAAACRAVEVWPVRTNAAFLACTLTDTDFVAGRIDTGFIARHPSLVPADTPPPQIVAQAAHALLSTGEGPWATLTGFRVGAVSESEIAVTVAGHACKAVPAAGTASVWDNVLFANGQAWPFGAPRFAAASESSSADGMLVAPMPGMITVLHVKPGERVKRGETLMVLEAMKTENSILAPFDGKVERLDVDLGSQVGEGAVLAKIGKAE
jgi:3-methylcrotonyl-CoA carboxylase alpha subunit